MAICFLTVEIYILSEIDRQSFFLKKNSLRGYVSLRKSANLLNRYFEGSTKKMKT